jgi:hypothetical protein
MLPTRSTFLTWPFFRNSRTASAFHSSRPRPRTHPTSSKPSLPWLGRSRSEWAPQQSTTNPLYKLDRVKGCSQALQADVVRWITFLSGVICVHASSNHVERLWRQAGRMRYAHFLFNSLPACDRHFAWYLASFLHFASSL